MRRKLVDIVHGHETHVCVPMQGSGTFSVEAAVNTLVPRDGHVLVLVNGAYGTRMAKLTQMMGRKLSTFETAEDVPTTPQDVDRLLAARRVDHARRADPLRDVDRDPESAAPKSPPSSRATAGSLIVDAMSSFAAIGIDARTIPFDALIAASGNASKVRPAWVSCCARKAVLEKCAGNSSSLALDLHDQWTYMERTTQWRYTPPTHVVVAFNAALDQLIAEGGQPARLARYTRNCETLVGGMARARVPARS